MLHLILSLILVIVLVYFLILLIFIIGLLSKEKNQKKQIINNNVSVIICVRNGQSSLNNILNDLKSQVYNGEIEFIIVVDNSTDQTEQIILEHAKSDSRFKYAHSDNGGSSFSFKKKAIDAGIKNSKYDYLLFTDVDCRLNNQWVKSMMQQYNYEVDYIIGCSIVRDSSKLVSTFQKTDFLMLMIASLSSTDSNFPLACTGQNQSYKKELYQSIGFSKISHLLQGDDSIFMQLCNKNKSINVKFNTDKKSFVSSKSHSNWKDLLLQRIRWAADANIMWKYNFIFYIIIIATFITNLSYLIMPIIFFNSIKYIAYFFILKFILEISLYYIGIKKLDQKFRVVDFIKWFFIQIPYVVLVGILSFFISSFKWRGRAA